MYNMKYRAFICCCILLLIGITIVKCAKSDVTSTSSNNQFKICSVQNGGYRNSQCNDFVKRVLPCQLSYSCQDGGKSSVAIVSNEPSHIRKRRDNGYAQNYYWNRNRMSGWVRYNGYNSRSINFGRQNPRPGGGAGFASALVNRNECLQNEQYSSILRACIQRLPAAYSTIIG